MTRDRVMTYDEAIRIYKHLRDYPQGSASYFWGQFEKCKQQDGDP